MPIMRNRWYKLIFCPVSSRVPGIPKMARLIRIFNTMTTDDPVTQEARTSAAMVLT